jgi:hypothetical protein
MMRWLPILTLATAAAGTFVACDSRRFQQTPFVQDSAEAEARYKISMNRVVNGRFRSYLPRCRAGVRVGETVEWRNFLPDVATNVTSVAAPPGASLYSPNLVTPYNYVGPDDEDNDVCDATDEDGACIERPAFTWWRHTFERPGVYDWIDTNQGEPGRQVVDPYYGTVTFIGTDPNTPIATVCVEDESGGGCESVCCQSDADCLGDTTCVRDEGEAVGRCLTR